ncbi:MAG TPA: zinc-dependent metalloprotease, partial [Gemmatimonadaceae bacterium]|nr:zinc-dependent metalloprotease [Gemmatimonadaceae bacterium]
PAARTLEIPESLMGETMTKVITHEIGHAIGLPHNMVASSSFPVDSLRSPSFTRPYGVSATIMDYARQNYIAQPGDGLAPNDYIRRLGPFDDFVVNWGYRVLPNAATPEAEVATLNRWITSQTGMFAYRYVPQQYGSVDPRSQTEDMGDDPVRASTYAIANLKRVVPMLPEWTTAPGKNYDDLSELHGEAVSMWSRYMGHVVTLIGGVTVDFKTADQPGAVFHEIPRERQEGALAFLDEQVFDTPEWLTPDSITSRIGPVSVVDRQVGIVNQLLDTRRIDRLAEYAAKDDDNWSPTEYLNDLRRALWGTPGSGTAPDANRRQLQRAYLDRLETILKPAPPSGGQGGGFGGGGGSPPPLLAAPNVPRSDLPALARGQLSVLRDQVRRAAANAPAGIQRAHWQDIAVRIDAILDPGVAR